VFPRPEVEARLRKFVKVRLFINDRKPAARSPEWRAMLEKRFGTTAIPLYVVLRPDGETVGTLGFPGGSLDAFVLYLNDLLDRGLGQGR